MQLHVAGNCTAQFALQGEHAARLAVIGTGPDLQLVARTNQLRRDPQLPPSAWSELSSRYSEPSSAPIVASDFVVRL